MDFPLKSKIHPEDLSSEVTINGVGVVNQDSVAVDFYFKQKEKEFALNLSKFAMTIKSEKPNFFNIVQF